MIKRLFDIFFSLIGIIILLPIFLLIGILIKLDSNGPIIFKHKRVGLNSKVFIMHKFRSMKEHLLKNSIQLTMKNDKRITKIGLILRKYKIDELPQLYDVLIGNMSFVGPRPEVEKFINCYSENTKKKILSTRPGITDYSSIKFSNESEMIKNKDNPEEYYIKNILPIKQKYYLRYINEKSLYTDLKIIMLTLKKIIFNY